MEALVTQGIGEPLVVAEVPDPTPEPGELVIRVEACGICGSDLHMVDAFGLPGHVLGHEFCGEVVAIGGDVSGWKAGDRLAALSLVTCGTCSACRAGLPRKCATALMTGAEVPGAYAQFARVRAHDARRLPEGFSADHGALVEPLAVARHSIERGAFQPGESALVLGGGPVGLAVVLWLRALGADQIVVSEPQADRAALARAVGADATVDPLVGDPGAQTADVLGGPPPLVIECVGLPGLIEQGAGAAAIDGRVVVAGVCFGEDHIVPFGSIAKELDLRFSFYYRGADYDETITAIESGALDPSPLVTGHVGLAEASDRFEALKRGSADAKVLIVP